MINAMCCVAITINFPLLFDNSCVYNILYVSYHHNPIRSLTFTHNYNLKVEVWLNALLDRMIATIRHNFMDAVVTYEEKPREQWIFDPPAQVQRWSTDPNWPGMVYCIQYLYSLLNKLNKI